MAVHRLKIHNMKIALETSIQIEDGGTVVTWYHVMINSCSKFCSRDREKSEKIYEEIVQKGKEGLLSSKILKCEDIQTVSKQPTDIVL